MDKLSFKNFKSLPFEQKIKQLSEADKNYLNGYIDKSLQTTTKKQPKS